MPQATRRLDTLLDEVREVAFAEREPKETVNALLQSARTLIELSMNITDLIPSGVPLPFSLDLISRPEEASLIAKRRFQEDHVNPAIQQQFSGSLYQIRRTRDRVFNEPELFGDPAWDILLDLVYAERDHKSVSVTSACMASCVPPTTGLRWVSVLEAKGYIERAQDRLDGRRRYIMLTDKARTLMNRVFSQLVRRQLM